MYLAIMLNTMLNAARDHDKFKKLKQHIEEKFSKNVFARIQDFSQIQKERIIDFLGAYISQLSGKELGQAEPFLLKLKEGQISPEQKQALKDVFNVICRFVFVKKAKD